MQPPYPPQVYPDRPQESLDEAIYKISFLGDVLAQPTHPGERFTLSEDGQIGLGYILRDVKAQLRAASDALLDKLRKEEAKL